MGVQEVLLAVCDDAEEWVRLEGLGGEGAGCLGCKAGFCWKWGLSKLLGMQRSARGWRV